MSINLTLLTVMGALYACGIYLILERSLTRVLLGLMLLTNATNLLILTTGGYAGLAPLFSKDTPAREYNDPLPQALILTSIVISFAVTAFMLGIIYRTWVLVNLIQKLGQAGKTIITATHELEIVPLIASRVIVLGEDRRILADGEHAFDLAVGQVDHHRDVRVVA